MAENSNLILWFTSDFGGCGHLRSLWINETLNSYYGSRKMYEGLASSRFIVDNNILKQARVYHFQRQITDGQLDYIKFVKKFRDENKKEALLIYDLDDRITDIPDFNYAKRFFHHEYIFNNMKTIFNMVDLVTVSTEEMSDWVKIQTPNANVKVVPNFVPKNIYKPYEFKKEKNTKPRVVWAGSANHFSDQNKGDFEIIYDLIVNTINEFEWVLVGMKKLPTWIEHLSSKIKTVPWVPIVNFPMVLKSLNADFGVAPLIPDIFNEAKSNIKLLDYWSADLITICSPLKPYAKENELFFSGDWQKDRATIMNIFNDEERTKNIIRRQNEKLNKYWLESNLHVYMNMFNLKY